MNKKELKKRIIQNVRIALRDNELSYRDLLDIYRDSKKLLDESRNKKTEKRALNIRKNSKKQRK